MPQASSTTSAPSPASPADQHPFSIGGRYYILAVLTAVSTVCYIDRQILVILQEPIKHKMGLSDTQLTGFAFVFLYVSCGIPIAHLADRTNRRNVIGASAVVWSIMTSITGFTSSYLGLLLARIGVGFGEAGAGPPSHSMIADLFSPKERATAIAIFTAGYPQGVLVGFLMGGMLGVVYGWRIAFAIAGVPGIVIAILLFTTVREPLRSSIARDTEHQPLLPALRSLWANRQFRFLCLFFTFTSMANNGIFAFGPVYLLRVYKLSLIEVSTAIALIFGIAGLLGPIVTAAIADRLSARDRRWRLWMPAITSALMFPLAMGTFFALTPTLSLTCYVGIGALIIAQFSPVISFVQQEVPKHRLSLASSVILLVNNVMGMGLGTLLVGMASDALQPSVGIYSLRYALAGSSCLYIVAVLIILYTAHTVRSEKSAAR